MILNRNITINDAIANYVSGNVKAQNGEQLFNYGNQGKLIPKLFFWKFDKNLPYRSKTNGISFSNLFYDRKPQVIERTNKLDFLGKFQGSVLTNLSINSIDRNFIAKNRLSFPNISIGYEERFNIQPILNQDTIFSGRFLQIPFVKNDVGQIVINKLPKIQNNFESNGSKLSSLKRIGALK